MARQFMFFRVEERTTLIFKEFRLLLHEEQEPVEWRRLQVGPERGVTNVLQRHCEGSRTGGRICNQDCTEKYNLHGKPGCQDGI